MIVSEARLAANRLNSLRSTGPVTEAGRANSRKNSFKSGLTGGGVVVADSDAEEIQARADALAVDLKPTTAAGALLIVQMATLSFRMERATEQESAAISMKVRHAADDFDDQRLDRVKQLFDSIADEPRVALIKLKRMPEGAEKLVEAWNELRIDLELDAWTDERLEQAANLAGFKARHALGTRFGALTRAMRGDFAGLSKLDGAGLADDARKTWAKSALLAAIDGEVDALEALHATLDFQSLALDRAEAGQRILFDDSKPAILARRYESEARRGFFKALKEFRQIEAEAAAQSEPAPSQPAPPQTDPKVASFRQTPPCPYREPSQPYPEPEPLPEGESLCYIPPAETPG